MYGDPVLNHKIILWDPNAKFTSHQYFWLHFILVCVSVILLDFFLYLPQTDVHHKVVRYFLSHFCVASEAGGDLV